MSTNRAATLDPLSQVVKEAVIAALDETGRPLSQRPV